MKLLKIKGIYNDSGTIELESLKTIDWKSLCEDNPPGLPPGIRLELAISVNEDDFLTGENGIVWATYDSRQTEVIQSALLAQHINSEIKKILFNETEMYLLIITDDSDLSDVKDFIWRNRSGLRLKPDWSYPDGEKNKSFEQWLSGQ